MKNLPRRVRGVLGLFVIGFGLMACSDLTMDNTSGADLQKLQQHIQASSLDGKEPLMIVNGKPLDAENILNLNPDDIKSVQVLRSYSAGKIYGKAGRNGVV